MASRKSADTDGRFGGKVVIVTGAASGIGEATARRFSREGASVVLADRQASKLKKVAADFPKELVLAHLTDVAKYRQVEALMRSAVKRFGGIDVLVNNAGIATGGKIADADLKDWDRIIAVNVTGVFHGCRAAMPYLIQRKGCIVNTASVSGLGGDWGMSIYDASKGAVVNFTRALALDHGRDGVRVNSVCPTVTLTPMTGSMRDDKKLMAKVCERIPLGRPAMPDDIAAVIAFLASADAGFITGVNLPVDGGVTASNGQANMQSV
jgi:meso-butanediol dehydrogenase/(S,S)-butanediol dehydrogenase/diacetyl reductase